MKKIVKPLITVLLVAALLVPTVAMLVSYAATSYTVELAFDNLFVFEQWASNQNSTRITSDGAGGSSDGTLSDVNIEEGSFKLTNNITSAGIYTTASMGSGESADENGAFYSMAVKEGHTYKISYNVTGSIDAGFHPYVFYYDKDYNFVNLFMQPSTGSGDNSFTFTIPEGMNRIQVRFTMPAGSSYGIIKNIAIYEVETLSSTTPELFDFSTWSTKSGAGGGVFSLWNAGTVTPDSTNESVTFTSSGADTGSATGVGACSVLLNNMAYGSAYGDTNYVIDVEPGKQYTVSYELEGTMASPANVSFFPVWHDSNKDFQGFVQYYAASIGKNSHTITVPDNIYYFEVVFGLYDYTCTSGVYATISNISIKEVAEDSVIEHKVDPHRMAFTYSGSGDTYGELPTPPASMTPDGYIFAGWYTGENGTGTRITADTPIQPLSYTVYPKYEPALDSLTVLTPPNQIVYTLGEKLNTAGLVLQGTINSEGDTDGDGAAESTTTTINISSGYYCTPEILNTAGTQTITAHYGGKTATFTVTVKEYDEGTIVINGTETAVNVANNNYTLDYQAETPFNRYEMTYYSDSYVSGIITMDDNSTEEFFLEPSDNGSFASYIDGLLESNTHSKINSIAFTCLNKEYGKFELRSVTTVASEVPNATEYYENSEFKVGIALNFGGVVSEIYDVDDDVRARVYNENGNAITKVDYADKLTDGHLQESTEVNLINVHDRGRYLQQSYYGTSEKPFEMGDYNGVPWNYNPVQGGNLESTVTHHGGEASKVIDYRITDDQIYVKTRPLDWGKNSVDYPDSYNTPSYMEAWYVFEDNMIKVYCRFVDYSGYPAATTTQEMPALYTIEPLNHFVYNDVDTAWSSTNNYVKIEEPEFWGVLPEYNEALKANGMSTVNPDRVAVENWAAFMASDDADSFGIGVYSAGVEDMHFGTYPAIYNEETVKENGSLVANYRHAQTTNPADEPYTSYISPVDVMTFESYSPVEYSFYITTGTVDEIQSDFEAVALKDNAAELAKAKIAVPETVYMTPANGASTVGEYYVNNILDESNNYSITTEASRDAGMYLGLHIEDAKEFSVKVTNATEPSNDIFLCNTSGSEISESTRIAFGAAGTYTDSISYGLRFSGDGLEPGEQATAKWEITVYFNDGSTETYTAYTVMYAPGRTVGAVSEARQTGDYNHEISSWITGSNGVDHSQFSPLSSWYADYRNSGYFTSDPLHNTNPPTGGSSESSTDYISGYGTTSADDYNDNAYVMQAATNGHDSSRATSYLGLLMVDSSRYTNTDQIPNLKIGFDVLRVEGSKKNSLGIYNSYYTLGTESAYTSTSLSAAPSGWTTFKSYEDYADGNSVPGREYVIPSYDVSEIDGKYIHALNQGKADYTAATKQYSTAITSVLCTVTDKGELRELVLDVYTMTDTTPLIDEKLEAAATVLGDPSATQEEIDQAKKELNDVLKFALKYDNLFSAHEFYHHTANMVVVGNRGTASYSDGAITVVNETITSGEAYTEYAASDDYYKIDISPNTEYIFEYDVTTSVKSQAFLFFYNSSNANSEAPTNIQVKTNNGSWTDKTEANSWIGNYQNSAGSAHYAIRFTTGATTTQVGFRFGNTSNDPTTSTFTNIKLIDAAHYYEDAVYEKTEAVYQRQASYGSLITPTRTGYTFSHWEDADGNTITGSTVATCNRTVYSVWTENSYTIVYNANGGSGSIASQKATYTENVTLANGGFTKSGYILAGWATTSNATSVQYQLGQTVNKLSAENNSTVTLFAVWSLSNINVTFDNLIDIDKWTEENTPSNATISNLTDTGFTLTSTNPNGGEGTYTSPFFTVEAGKDYMIDIDITDEPWDVYIFFCDANGNWIDFVDGESNRYSNNTTWDTIFTAPNDPTKAEVVKAQIRVDANSTSQPVTFNNIRVYEYDGISEINVEPANKFVISGQTFGELPTPTKEGYSFVGWYDGDTLITADSAVTQTSTVYLTSKWVISDTALVADTVVIDFALPIEIAPFKNDTIFNSESGEKKLLGVSTDGASYSETLDCTYGSFTVSGETVTYTPAATVDGTDVVYYHASVTADGVTTTIKSQITVAPASNVLYEEGSFTVGTASGLDWTKDGTTETGNQDTYLSDTKKEVYGYDTHYDKVQNYSNGSALKVTVDAENKRSKLLSFAFTGTGFDLNGVCGPATGVQIATLKNNDTNKMVKSYIVDTYYGDAKYGTLYQVPVISENGLGYASYTLQIVASYLPSVSGALNTGSIETQDVNGMTVNTADAADSAALREALAEIGMEYVLDAEAVDVIWFDDDSVLNGGMGVDTLKDDTLQTAAVTSLLNVVDSVRVYNPITDGNSYYISSETNAKYYNVIDNLVNGDGTLTGSGNFAYVSGKDAEEISIETYDAVGPKDELYLTKATTATKAVTFTINNFDKNSVNVMISLRAASGTPQAKIGEAQFSVNSNTEMYYDITDYIADDGTVTIQNVTDSTLLAVGSLKITSEALEAASLSTEFNLMTARNMIMSEATDVDPNAPDVQPEEPGTTDEPSADDNSSECWLIRLFKWIIGICTKVFNTVKSVLGF